MFCEECGTKNETGASFCENCGHKMAEQKPVKVKAPKKPIDKKMIGIISVISIVLIGIITFFAIGFSITNPKNVAYRFFKAGMTYDVDSIYDTLYLPKSEFVSKEIFIAKNDIKDELEDLAEELGLKVDSKDLRKQIFKTMVKTSNVSKLSEINKKEGTAKITIDYKLNDIIGKSDVEHADIELKKDGKKLLFFDDWKVVTNKFISNDIEVRVIEGSKVKLDGIQLSSEYITKDDDKVKNGMDVYVIPAVISGKYEVKISLPFGLESEDTTTFNRDNDYYAFQSYSSLTLPDDTKSAIEKTLKSDLQKLYNSAIEEKLWNSIKKDFEYKDGNLSNLESDYSSLSRTISRLTKKLTEIKFSDVTVKSATISDNKLRVNAVATYTYKLSYKEKNGDTEEEKEYQSKDQEDDITFYMDSVDGKFKLIDMSGYNTYYSAN